MKIDSIGTYRTKAVRRGERGQGVVGDGFTEQLGEETAASAVSTSAPMTSVDALLALQEVPADSGRRARSKARGQAVLDELEQLRLGLLLGFIPRDKLAQLSEMAQDLRAQATDPRLAEILGEIELRAQVELAKLGQVA